MLFSPYCVSSSHFVCSQPLPYEVMHAYLPVQEKMTEMVHSPISSLLYFVDHANLITIWAALLLECKVMIVLAAPLNIPPLFLPVRRSWL